MVNSDNYIGGWSWQAWTYNYLYILYIYERKQDWLWINVCQFEEGLWCASWKESERFDKDTNKRENFECTSIIF